MATAFSYGRGDKSLRVWDTETGELRRYPLPAAEPTPAKGAAAVTGYEGSVSSLRFMDESVLYTAGWAGVRRWDLATGTNERVPPWEEGLMTIMAMSADGQTAVITSFPIDSVNPKHRLWDRRSGTTRPLTGFEKLTAVALDASGVALAWGDEAGLIHVGRVADGVAAGQLLAGHEGPVANLAFSPDGRWIASAGEDNTLRLWPMPHLSKPPLESLPRAELVARLRSLTNIRVVRAPESEAGWKLDLETFPGWKDVPTW